MRCGGWSGIACYTRTGYHSAITGEWRDGDGLTAALFLHHLSRDGDPQLHVHAAMWNRVQRADGADDKWRTLHGRALYQQRLGMAPVPDRFLEARLRELGYCMVPAEGRQRVRGRRGLRGGDGAVLLPRRRGEPGAGPAGRGVGADPRQAAVQAGAVAVAPAGGAEHAAQQGGGAAHRQRAGARHRAVRRGAAGGVGGSRRTAAEMQALSRGARGGGAVRTGACTGPRHGRTGACTAHAESVHLPPVPWRVLSDADQRRAARVAVAEAQRHHATWSMAQLRYEVHRALGARVSEADVTEVAGAGRVGPRRDRCRPGRRGAGHHRREFTWGSGRRTG